MAENIQYKNSLSERLVATKWHGEDFMVENGCFEIRSALWVYIDDLPANILSLLNTLEK